MILPEVTSFEIAKLSLRPPDVLVVKVERTFGWETRHRIESAFLALLPAGCKVAVIDPDMALEVVQIVDGAPEPVRTIVPSPQPA